MSMANKVIIEYKSIKLKQKILIEKIIKIELREIKLYQILFIQLEMII